MPASHVNVEKKWIAKHGRPGGYHLGKCWVNKNCVFQLCMLKYMLKSILIIEINHASYLKHLGRISGPNLGKNLHFRQQTFWKEKSNQRKVVET